MSGHHRIIGLHEMETHCEPVKPNPALPSPAMDSSSPSQEFSFAAISLSKTSQPLPAAVDLSPADEIFFHGHLLPLHLLSHLTPRASTDTALSRFSGDRNYNAGVPEDPKLKQTPKHQFSLFRIPARWRAKPSEAKPDGDGGDRDTDTGRKSKFDVVRRYLRLIRPGFLLGKGNKKSEFLRRQQCSSYSGNLRVRSSVGRKWTIRGRRGECYASAPATMGNSPTNSGVLAAAGSGAVTPTAAKSDSTMEELQAAIQAAIAHCKNSVANGDDVMPKLPPHN